MNGWKGRIASTLPSPAWKILHSSHSLLDRFRTSSARKNVPNLQDAKSITDIRRMTLESVRSVLKTENFEYSEENWFGRIRFHVTAATTASLADAFGESGMICEPSPSNDSLHLSLFAHSLRQNVARGLSIEILASDSRLNKRTPAMLNQPIDVVYTWVDSEDPQWKKDYADALALHGSSSPRTASDIVRFQDRDELKYSLRALEMFAPWVNHIYLVTSGQVPSWLDVDNPRITLVRHADIFEQQEDLPTFNSHAIEANLHRIPGLNEHFLYFNDDVFLADCATPETFFTSNGKSKYFESNNNVPSNPLVTDLPSNWAAFNNKKLLEDSFEYVVTKKFKHTAHAQRLTTLKKAALHFREKVDETVTKKFRDRSDIALPSNLAHHFGSIIGTAVAADIKYRYIDLNSARVDVELSRLLLWDDPTIFCLNQVRSRVAQDRSEATLIQNFLEKYFPWKSSAEL